MNAHRRSACLVTIRTVVIALGCIGFGLAPSVAEAARKPTRSERAAIIRAVGARQCEVGKIRVSTVDRRWAIFDFGFAPGFSPYTCPNVPTGSIFLQKRRGKWRKMAIGSDITCDQRGLPPRAVQNDLKRRCRTVS